MNTINNHEIVDYESYPSLFEQFISKRGLAKSSVRTYRSAIRDYELFNRMSIEDLIEEADIEEENNVRMKRRRLKNRLENYLLHNINTSDLLNSSSLKYFNLVLSFYRHFQIQIPYLQKPIIKKDYHITYADIPNEHHIRKALNACNNIKEEAIILFMSSSGSAKNETLHLKVSDFFNATKEYHNEGSIAEMLKMLKDPKNQEGYGIVPLFELVRLKTDYLYYTCCSPEASNRIISELVNRYDMGNLNLDDYLFDMTDGQLLYFFRRINKKYNWGKVGTFDFWHSHALRKFVAIAIEDKSLVDAIQGRRRDTITEAYFIHNPYSIKEMYLKVMHKVRV